MYTRSLGCVVMCVHAQHAHVCDVYCTGTCTCVGCVLYMHVCVCVCVCVWVVIGDDRATCKTCCKYNCWQRNSTGIHAAYCVLKVMRTWCGSMSHTAVWAKAKMFVQRASMRTCMCGYTAVYYSVHVHVMHFSCHMQKPRHMFLYITMSLAVHVYACRGRHTPGCTVMFTVMTSAC